MQNLWEEAAVKPHFGRLHHDMKTDVLIIGGGITGILCAYMLHQAGVDYVLAEAKEICGGITKNTTAKITFQHGLIYSRLVREFGAETARLYLQANEQAFEMLCSLCQSVDCDFAYKDNYVYSRDRREKIRDEIDALQTIGYKAELVGHLPLPFTVAGAVRFPKQAQFSPLKFLYKLSNRLRILENTPVLEMRGKTAVTENGCIAADKVIVVTHFPFLNKHGFYFLKLYQHRSYVLALENAQNVDGMYVDCEQSGLSFRNAGDLLLLGGSGHRTGKKGRGWQELRRFADLNYRGALEKYSWAAQDCMTLDGIPYIGAYSSGTDGLYVATGFNKWGMTSAMTAALLLRDLVTGKSNPYVAVFSPSRTILRPQLAVNALETTVSLLTPTAPRCPHMGCALKWNRYEHTWDCPCHGSRFTKDGKLIDNPATGNLKTNIKSHLL